MILVSIDESNAGTIIYNVSFDYNKVTIGSDTLSGVTYTTVNYDGFLNHGNAGYPSLPVDYIKFSVPYNACNFTVAANTLNSTNQPINHLVYPCQASRMMSDTSALTISYPNNIVYQTNSFYPSQSKMAWVVNEGFLAGENHIVTIAVMPIRYKHSNGSGPYSNYLQIAQTIRLEVSYELSDTLSMSPLISLNEMRRIEGQKMTRNIVINPDSVSAFAYHHSSVDTLYTPYHTPVASSPLPSYPYLIVTDSILSHSLRRLAALKRQKGYNVRIVTLDEIMNDPYAQYGDVVRVNGMPTVAFPDSAGIIRQYLKLSKWYFGTDFLLLAGSSVPFRIQPKALPHKTYQIPTDLYYSDLNGNWTRNSTIDIYPDLFVGRILAKTDNQISNYTDKLLRYELNPGGGDFSYLKRALYTEAVGFYDYSREIGTNMNSICPDSMIIRERRHAYYPKAMNVIDSINTKKFGFWCTYNHGCPTSIITYGINAYNKVYSDSVFALFAEDSVRVIPFSANIGETDNDLNNIDNRGYEMISYSTSCETMPFNVKTEYNNKPISMNFGESFTTGKDYGGPAYLGNTSDGIYPGLKYLARSFAEDLLNESSKIGIAEGMSKIKENDQNFNDFLAMSHNLLGDPTIDMWTDIPQSYSSISVTRADDSVSIRGLDVDSTIIAYYGNDYRIGSDTFSTSDVNIYGISPNDAIMIYKHNYIPYIVPMVLQNFTINNSQYVIASDVIAGRSVDSGRTRGYVTVKNGVEYEIEASGTVYLDGGFKVEKGATFAVYPACF